jgi:quercetin dioxygenase-like cupin family protein
MITALAISSAALLAHAQEPNAYSFDKVQWQPAGLAGAEMAMLWGDESKGTAVWAFRLQPGVRIPAHTHSRDYWGFAIQGNWVHVDASGKEVITDQNAYAHIRANDMHGDRCAGPQVCINILKFEGPRDIFFPKTVQN